MRRNLIALAACSVLALSAVPATAQSVDNTPPPAPYRKVSELVKLPDFIPGMGTLYVDPKTLPEGPYLAYDHKGKFVSTIYMISLKHMEGHKNIADLAAPGDKVDHVSIQFNAGHPGVPEPHYYIVLWNVSAADEQLVVK